MTLPLVMGAPAPWFFARALNGNPRFSFSSLGGRAVLMLFAGSMARPDSVAAFACVAAARDVFDATRACFFGVTADPEDEKAGRIRHEPPGISWFLDSDRAISRGYGAIAPDGGDAPYWLLLDAQLRAVAHAPLAQGEAMIARLRALVAEQADLPAAPVLVVPRVLPPALCRDLIAHYEREGGVESGFMREEGGITVVKTDPNFKRRADVALFEGALLEAAKARVIAALLPMVKRAFQFEVTRIERWLVARYDGAERGFFNPHRDNSTAGTAHRRFACTINLNPDDYEGGDLRFPEFGRRTYRAPQGGAVVFSCSLLHEARPVTRGRRYALLPFFYDEAAARLREANQRHVDPALATYRAGTG
jgi:predicted 2-oxoglutarate/Fe(II)-dependent dioxygenase YbiX